MRFGKIRAERETTQQLALGTGPIPIVVKMHAAERGMGERQGLVQFQSLHGCRFGFGSGFQRSQIRGIHCHVSFGEPGIGKGIVRVELDGLLKITERLLTLASLGPRQIVAAFEISLVSSRVYWASIAQVSFLLGRKFDLYFIGYRHSELLLQDQDIPEIPLIVLSPEMRLILDLDELSANAHAIA